MKCEYGGFSRAVEYVKNIKKDKYSPNSLSVNSGDFFVGDMLHIAFKGGVAADMAKHMPYDAIAVRDKYFSEGDDGLLPFMRALGKVFVCTNMDFSRLNSTLKQELLDLCPRHRMITLSGKQIAIFGYLAPDSVSLSKLGLIYLDDEVKALNREVAVVQEQGAHILIALGHSGYERDKEIAGQVPGLDVIVGGHSPSLLWPDIYSERAVGKPPDPEDTAIGPYPTVIRRDGRVVLIVNAYWGGKYIGNINVTFDNAGEVKD